MLRTFPVHFSVTQLHNLVLSTLPIQKIPVEQGFSRLALESSDPALITHT